ncbi:MAG: hypothetical protein FJW40_27525 [Acidobacteria bacterium]|nr:hypothetical protein [Acidobacteriota bacterium]
MHTLLGRRTAHAGPLLLALVSAACTQSPPHAPQAKATPPVQAAAPAKVDLNRIFPAGPGRELVLNNCTTCHTFVPIVILRMSKDAWTRNSRDHRERVKALSDTDFKTLYEYLVANFNPEKPVPDLPPELLQTWTTY